MAESATKGETGGVLKGLLRRAKGGPKAAAPPPAAAAKPRKESVFKPDRPPEEPKDPAWPPERLRLIERLWGLGHSMPGGDDYILDQFRVFSPNSAMSMLQVGAGLGGDGRSLALNFGTWVTCIESSKPLIELGMKESYKHGMEKKAPLVHFDPAKMKVRPNAFDVVFSRLGLHTMADKQKTIEQMASGVKPSGHLLLFEMVPGEKADAAALESWARNEPKQPHLISGPKMAELIREQDLDLRVVQDVSPEYRRMVMMGFAKMMASLKKKDLKEDKALAKALMREAEMWMRRMALMDTGVLRIVRFHALAPANKRRKKKPLPTID